MLISTDQLREHLHDPDWVIFDCRHDLPDPGRGAKLYRESHVTGAHFAPVDTALSGVTTGKNGRHPLPPAELFAGFLARHGVTAITQVVAYDDVGGQYAARLWWLARWIGLTRIGVLDGGFQKWVSDGYPVTQDMPLPHAAGDFPVRPDRAMLVTADEVLAGISNERCLVVDARTPERYRGEVEPIDPVAGRIPTAVNRPFKMNLTANLVMRPAAELKSEFELLLRGRPPAEAVHQCGSGITACANLLAMEHAGLPGSKLYVGSWSEWIADLARPVARGA